MLAFAKMFVLLDWAGIDCESVGNIPLGAGWLASSGASIGFINENKLFVIGCVDCFA